MGAISSQPRVVSYPFEKISPIGSNEECAPNIYSPNSLINVLRMYFDPSSVREKLLTVKKKKKKKKKKRGKWNRRPFVRVRVVEGEVWGGAWFDRKRNEKSARGVESGGQAKKGALAGWRRAEESFPVMRLLSKPISSWRAERPVPLASQKSTLDNASRYGWSNLLLSRTAARGEKKAGGKGWGGRVAGPGWGKSHI